MLGIEPGADIAFQTRIRIARLRLGSRTTAPARLGHSAKNRSIGTFRQQSCIRLILPCLLRPRRRTGQTVPQKAVPRQTTDVVEGAVKADADRQITGCSGPGDAEVAYDLRTAKSASTTQPALVAVECGGQPNW